MSDDKPKEVKEKIAEKSEEKDEKPKFKKVDVRELEKAPAATKNEISIMSALPEKKKLPLFPIFVVALVISIVGNILLVASVLRQNETINLQTSEIDDYKIENNDLKVLLNELSV